MDISYKIEEFVERFQNNSDFYKRGSYNETQLRREFIDPFFEELGWDITNKKGYAEAYKDVIHEDAIKVGGVTKAPDYCFRIGGVRKFFLEAKKPSINLKDDIHPAYQIRRYAWSAKLPLSILTDFEEFAVYDCRVKPTKTDNASHSRILYMRYTDYLDRWEEISNIFSREAILKGSFDKYVESKKGKHGTSEVDSAFLQEIEHWRDLLARNIALRNSGLTQQEINFAVQVTIDRIIFLRICEDRGIESYGRLMSLQNGNNVYERLFQLFYKADKKYNSGLFSFSEKGGYEDHDSLTPYLIIDDKTLKDIFKNLYYPDSPYEFSVLPSDILGHVYEQFLGKVIRLTPAHHAIVEDKPEVRKAGGVYYTPTFIVDYIVKNTVGKLVEGKKPGPRGAISKLKILDPACGSGSFLLGAYQFLLDWHRDEYIKDGPEKWARGRNPRLYQNSRGEWKLTIEERKRILLNNIHGVDIDPQAVEVTKLSLLLKVLEGEDEQTIGHQLSLFQKRVLPDLENNIKCGNSLIGPDFYETQQMSLFDEEEIYRINIFDWEKEFAEIMENGGFDAAIGNPPYVRQELLGSIKSYFQNHYNVYHGIADLYVYFIEKGVSVLRPDGLFSIIVANKWMRANYGKPLRKWLKKQNLIQIIDFNDLPVFKEATTYPSILTIQKAKPQTKFKVTKIKTLDFVDLGTHVKQNHYPVHQNSLDDNGWSLVDENRQALLEKLRNSGIPLEKYVGGKIFYGIKTGLNEAFVIDASTCERLIAEDPESEKLIKPFLLGRDIKRYKISSNKWYLILIPKGWTNKKSGGVKDAWKWFESSYPGIAYHLKPFSEKARKRYDKGEYWWELRTCDYYEEFEKPKIIYPNICQKPEFTFDEYGTYTNQKCFIISKADKYLLGILNSTITFFWFNLILPKLRGNFFEPSYIYFKKFPIPIIDSGNPHEESYYTQIVELVDKMLDLHKELQQAKIPQTKTLVQRQIETIDKQIDQLVYKLYGLTDDEIKIVESETQ